MTNSVFIKRYQSRDRATAARAHWAWLADLQSGVRLPALHSATTHELVFEHLGSRHPTADDLPPLAQAIGQLHAAAYHKHLHAARLDVPFRTHRGLIIKDFLSPRPTALTMLAESITPLPAALYKDANIRNFLLTDDGVAIIDFDDLTLAPFGYDLAKLIVSAAMTHGELHLHQIDEALDTYNSTTIQAGRATVCSRRQLRIFTELHHELTVRYVHRNGYRYRWSEIRPWRRPCLWR
jgi:hypothetical protein